MYSTNENRETLSCKTTKQPDGMKRQISSCKTIPVNRGKILLSCSKFLLIFLIKGSWFLFASSNHAWHDHHSCVDVHGPCPCMPWWWWLSSSSLPVFSSLSELRDSLNWVPLLPVLYSLWLQFVWRVLRWIFPALTINSERNVRMCYITIVFLHFDLKTQSFCT